MKLSDIKPCAICGHEVAPFIYEVAVTRHFISPGDTKDVLTLASMLGNNIKIAEAIGPTDDVTTVMDQHTAFVCQECGLDTFALVTERVNSPKTPSK